MAKIPFRHTLFLDIDLETVSKGALNVGLTSEKKYASKSTGTPADLNTSWTEYTNSGPTPSPGIKVQVLRLSGLSVTST